MSVKLLTEHNLEFLSLTGGYTQAHLSLHLSKCHIVGNHMPLLKCSDTFSDYEIVNVAMQFGKEPISYILAYLSGGAHVIPLVTKESYEGYEF